MKLSTRTRYGTRMLLYMASQRPNRPVPISEISKAIDVSVKYLEQLLLTLRKSELVKSVRGAKGGYLLVKDPRHITIGMIVRILENGFALAPCIDNPSRCSKTDNCLARGVWHEATDAMFKVLDSLTLAVLIQRKKKETILHKIPPRQVDGSTARAYDASFPVREKRDLFLLCSVKILFFLYCERELSGLLVKTG